MDNITKGDPIKADWANALTNAVNAAAHGKTALRGGGGQNVFISPYQRGSRPLAFDLVEITDDEEGSLSGKISGGVLLSAYKEEQEDKEEQEEKISLKTECMEISEYEATFQSGDKVWVHVTYDPDTWEAYVAILEKGKEPPGAEEGEACIVVGEFEERDQSIIYRHKGITCINWDAIKWEFEEFKLKTDPLCALELKEEENEKEEETEKELTLNIESSSEEEEEEVSIHALLAECDHQPGWGNDDGTCFNPRTPCGVRQSLGLGAVDHGLFQSTHSLRSATQTEARTRTMLKVSIHALVRVRHTPRLFHNQTGRFQSTHS